MSSTVRRPAHRRWLLSATALYLASLAPAWLGAQSAPPARTVWEGAYTDAQADRGIAPFGQNCSTCHSLAPDGNRTLVGQAFWDGFTQKSVADLLRYVSTSMPNGRGGSLPASDYSDIVAYLLKANGLPAGRAELGPDTGRDVQIVPKDGPGQLPAGTLVRVVGCLARSGADWVLTNMTAPQRIERSGVDAGDATRPLGDGTAALKFALTRLDPFVGQRLSVSGLLIGAGGSAGINVSAVGKVADTCP